MKRLCFTVLVAGLVTACGDPSDTDNDDFSSLGTGDESDETHTGDGDGDGDTGDGDGDAGDGDGDGDAGDGDGETGDGDDGFEPIPDGIFAEIPDLRAGSLELGPDHVFAQTTGGGNSTVIKISKQDASYEVHTNKFYNNLGLSGDYLYASGAVDLSRAAIDGDSALAVIGSLQGMGGLNEIVFTTTDLFVRRNWGNDGIYRFDHDGGPGTALVLGDFGRIQANGDRLFSTVNGNLVEIDTQTGAQTVVLEAVTRYHVGVDRLFFWQDGALHSRSLASDQIIELTADFGALSHALPAAADEHHIYWVNNDKAGHVGRVPIDGGENEVLHIQPSNVGVSVVRLDATHIYWEAGTVGDRGIWRHTK